MKFQGLIGNVFSQLSIDKATKLEYNQGKKINPNAKKSIGIDLGFGSLKLCYRSDPQLVDGKIRLYMLRYDRDKAGFLEMIDEVCVHITIISLETT